MMSRTASCFACWGATNLSSNLCSRTPSTRRKHWKKQFEGMSDTPFTYSDYEEARHNLIQQVNDSLTETDREFLLSFENGEPDWEKCCAGDLSRYPSVKWKLQNIAKLKRAILKSTRRDWKSYRPSYFRRRDKFYGHHAGQIGVNGKTIFGIMYNMREKKRKTLKRWQNLKLKFLKSHSEKRLLLTSSSTAKKLAKAKDRRGMIVIEDTESGKIVGWVWMEKKQNSLTGGLCQLQVHLCG